MHRFRNISNTIKSAQPLLQVAPRLTSRPASTTMSEPKPGSKLIVVLGITGNQGNSVATRFLQDPRYKIRGVTRNVTSEAAKALTAKGVELVTADLDDASTLVPAFRGANIIFSVTNYWEPFFRPDCRQRAAEQGISCNKFAYDVELRQGKNITDAAATTVDTLDDNGFIVSTLSAGRACTAGRMQGLYHFDAKADVFPTYVQERHPDLAKKMSCVQTGVFMTSFKLAPTLFLAKQPDGTFQTRMPASPSAPIPHLNVNADTGTFVYAVSQMPPGKSYMAAGTNCSWSEYARLWSAGAGVPCSFKQISMDDVLAAFEDESTAREVGDMFVYSSDPGYDGGDSNLLWAEDLRKAGIDCPMETLEEFMKKYDWSGFLNEQAGLEKAFK